MTEAPNNYIINQPIHLNNNIQYISIPKHRSHGYSEASIWTISIKEEFQSFNLACEQKWIKDNFHCSLHMVEETIEFLGKLQNGEESKIAKFNLYNQENLWHGYPADYKRKIKDRPPIEILTLWKNKNYITKSQMSRINGGQPCNL